MASKIVLFLLLVSFVHANYTLKETYYVNTNDINLSVLLPKTKHDTKLYTIEQNRYTKRVKSKELLKLLSQHGYNNLKAQSRFVKFIKKSPVDLSNIKQQVKNFYKSKYKNIHIKHIELTPRGYITSLPKEYEVTMASKDHLRDHGTMYIKTDEKKKIFFDYKIKADLRVYVARHDLKRDVELSVGNVTKKSIILKKFKAMPLQSLKKELYQTKQSIKSGMVVTMRDIKKLDLIRRGSFVHVSLHNGNVVIEFVAKALHNAKMGDTTTLQRADGKRIKAVVTGKNKVEIK